MFLIWEIIIVGNRFSGLRKLVMLITLFTEAKEFKGMKQKLKILNLRLRQFNIFNWAGLQNKSLTTVNTSQMMMIPIHRAIKCFTCRKVSTPNQAFLLKSSKMSINRSQPHIRRRFDQRPMKLLAADLIGTIIQLLQYILLTGGQTTALIDHTPRFDSHTFTKINLLVHC